MNNRDIIALVIGLIVVVGGVMGCRDNSSSSERPGISVSILPLAYFVDQISGGDFEVTVVVPPGASPETYEPTPAQMKAVSRSEAFFQIGLIDFEHHLANGVRANNPDLEVVSLSQGLDLLNGAGGHSHDPSEAHTSHAHGVDPHIWLSPLCVKAMVAKIAESLATIQPDSAFKYRKNLKTINSRIDSLERYIYNSISNIKSGVFMIYHPFLSYYARDYDLEQLPVEWEGKEPSAAYLRELLLKARAHQLNTVFYQHQFSQSSVDALVREAGLTPVSIDPLAYKWFENMKLITDLLYKSFQ